MAPMTHVCPSNKVVHSPRDSGDKSMRGAFPDRGTSISQGPQELIVAAVILSHWFYSNQRLRMRSGQVILE